MYFCLVYADVVPNSHEIIKVAFVSKNEKSLLSFSKRLNIIANNTFKFYVKPLYYFNENNFYKVLTKLDIDDNFTLDIDYIEFCPDDLSTYSLKKNEFISSFPIITNPTKEQINSLCMSLFLISDYEEKLFQLKDI